MSFKVGDEVRIVKDWCFCRPRYFSDLTGKSGVVVEIDADDRLYPYRLLVDGVKSWVHAVELIQPTCPLARESAKLKAKVEQLEAEVNAWIERMRRGEW